MWTVPSVFQDSQMWYTFSQLKRVARSIYNTYLSDSAPYCVNIDDTAKIEEKDLEQPTSDMFNKAQSQVCVESS